ncbi:hypothetical protein L218DRAFT_1055350 [Marasmius fiardii PR-910]|nr:hypothetical protein L218DRAFT_1055350 [Marasmius fiardii PR-910]
MLNFKEYSVWVAIGGTPAQEFGVEVLAEQNTVTCWIPSEEGKTFDIRIKDNDYHTPISADILVDGISYGGKPMKGNKLAKRCKRGFRTSPTTVRPFMFSRLNTTELFSKDDDALACSASSDIGEIKVLIKRARITRRPYKFTEKPAPTQGIVHERAKKAVDHQTSLGENVVNKAHFSDTKSYGPPLVTFCFKYRPISMLQANGIAPLLEGRKRARSQEVKLELEDVIEISDDSDSEELARLRARVRMLEGRQEERASKKVKREPGVKREPIVGEVIDLTDL